MYQQRPSLGALSWLIGVRTQCKAGSRRLTGIITGVMEIGGLRERALVVEVRARGRRHYVRYEDLLGRVTGPAFQAAA